MVNKNPLARFARNAAANWVTWLFTAVVGFFLSPYVVEKLGATQYGVWTLIAGLVGYLGLLDLGIRQAVNRYTARLHAAGDHQEASLTISAALRLFGFLGILAVLLSGVLAYFVPILFNIPPALADDARTIVVLGGIAIGVSLIGGVFGGIVTGLERFDIQCYLEILITTARTVAVVFALRAGYGLVALSIILLSTSIFACVAYYAAARKLYSQLRIRLGGVLGPHMRTILAFSASLTVIYALGRIINYSQTAVIGAFLPIEAVTFFAIAFSLCIYANEVPRALANLMTPRVSAESSTGGAVVGELIVRVAKVATLVSAPLAFTFLLRGESFINLWMGPAYGELSGEVLRLLAAVVWLDASRTVLVQSLTGMAKQHTLIPGFMFEAACSLALSLALVHRFGIAGVAYATLIPAVLVSLGYMPHCLKKSCGVPVGEFLRSAVFLPTVACIPFAVASAALEHFLPATNLAIFFLQVIVILPLAPAAAWFLCLSDAEKSQVRIEVTKMIRR